MNTLDTYCHNYGKLVRANTEQDLLRVIAENLIEMNSKLEAIQQQILMKKC